MARGRKPPRAGSQLLDAGEPMGRLMAVADEDCVTELSCRTATMPGLPRLPRRMQARTISVNDRLYALPVQPTVVVCIDDCDRMLRS